MLLRQRRKAPSSFVLLTRTTINKTDGNGRRFTL